MRGLLAADHELAFGVLRDESPNVLYQPATPTPLATAVVGSQPSIVVPSLTSVELIAIITAVTRTDILQKIKKDHIHAYR